MPNGGIPYHLVLEPSHSNEYFLECHGPKMFLFRREEMDKPPKGRQPILELTPDETAAIVAFLKYWLTKRTDFDLDDPQAKTAAKVRYEF